MQFIFSEGKGWWWWVGGGDFVVYGMQERMQPLDSFGGASRGRRRSCVEPWKCLNKVRAGLFFWSL